MSLRSSSSTFTEEDAIVDPSVEAKANDAILRTELLDFIWYFLTPAVHSPLHGFLGDCRDDGVLSVYEGHASRMFKLGRRA